MSDVLPLDALLLDFDGTIVDSESTILASWSEEYAAHGLVLDHDVWRRTVGGVSDQYAIFGALVGDDFDRAAVQASVRAREAERVRHLPTREGIRECVEQALDAGLRLGVVSSSPLDWVGGHLERLGLRSAFDAVVTRESAPRAKPAPDLYREALARLGVEPARGLVVEDAANGITAARAAGLRCVAFPNSVTVHQDLSHADEILPTPVGDPRALWDAVWRVAGTGVGVGLSTES